MEHTQFHLLKVRRFLPLFVTQFLGAMNDNFFKQALVVLITFQLAEQLAFSTQTLVAMATGLFIAPFFLFSATAGQLADKFEKSRSIRLIKLFEIIIMLLAMAGFFMKDPYFLLVVLFLMGAQSTFFGPLKYGILPDHLHEDELIGGNALIEGATFLAILIGTIVGTLMIRSAYGIEMVSVALLVMASLGLVASLFVPRAEPPSPQLKINLNIVAETWHIVKMATQKRSVLLSVLGISWFWLVGATFLTLFPNFTKQILGADETVLTTLMVIFSIGIATGSLWCNRLLGGEVSARYVPFGALGLSIFALDLYFASTNLAAPSGELIGAFTFIGDAGHWRIMFDLFALSVCGGLYSVPLFAIIQHDSDESQRARTIAANNIVNALFMVVGVLATDLLLQNGLTLLHVFLIIAVINAIVAFFIVRLLPEALIKAAFKWALKLFYRVELQGLDHYKDAGERAVIVVNHVSFLDALLLAVFLPQKPLFAINSYIAQRWWIKPFLKLVEAFPLDPTNPLAIKALIKKVQENRHCVIFPEGRITVTGSLMKVYEGPGLVADKADAMVVPVRIDGAQYTYFSRMKGKLRLRWFPKITITILPPREFSIPEEIKGRARRQRAGVKLYDVMTHMLFETREVKQTLFEALLEARHVHGGKQPVIEDIERKPMTYNRLLLGAAILGRRFAKISEPKEIIGVLLPNAAATVVTFFALQSQARVPAMLNFSTGAKNMIAALNAACIKTIITSRRFVEMAKLEDSIEAMSEHVQIIYLEDIRKQVSLGDKILGIVSKFQPNAVPKKVGVTADDPAVVLFTSGSEGTPKGVVLSHANLLANRHQLAARIDFNATDIVFNALPVFHSFGLTGGMLLPVLSGIKTFLYPSPLHYRIVPALIYDSNATIMFGTDTFLAGYGRVAHPYDFYSMRYVFAGAEKLKDETRKTWMDKFGLRILEGYGSTETSPALTINTPMHHKPGTVGRFLPGIEYQLEAVPGLDEGKRLVVSGPNVMLGYLKTDNPGVLEKPEDQRYDTGDIVDVDEAGFVTILGRAKRFAKIAGEMVSLTAVEASAAEIWPDNNHAVISVEDARKGEQLILMTDRSDADRKALLKHAKENAIAELMVPRTIYVVDQIPLLGTGKVDYVTAKQIVEQAI